VGGPYLVILYHRGMEDPIQGRGIERGLIRGLHMAQGQGIEKGLTQGLLIQGAGAEAQLGVGVRPPMITRSNLAEKCLDCQNAFGDFLLWCLDNELSVALQYM